MRFDDCASIVQKRKGTGDDAIDFSYKRINKILSVRDKAIQCFERWNSKKGLAYLRNVSCYPKWLQNYVDKVIMYIERDGME